MTEISKTRNKKRKDFPFFFLLYKHILYFLLNNAVAIFINHCYNKYFDYNEENLNTNPDYFQYM